MTRASDLPIAAMRFSVLVALLLVCASASARQQPPQFTATVNTVRVDVVVTDGDDDFVGDLSTGDFTLFEDGERQEIVGVQLVDLEGGQIWRLGAAEPAPAGAEEPPVPVGATPGGETPSDLGAVIFFIDLPGLYLQNKARFDRSMSRVFDSIDRLTLPHAIYLVDLAGRLHELQPLTTDLETLRRAAAGLRERPAAQDRWLNLLHQGALDTDGGQLTRLAQYDERRRALYTYELLRDFVDSLADRAGRTALVWVSMGVDLAGYETVQAQPYRQLGDVNPLPGGDFRSYSPDAQMRGVQEALHRAANSANVSIYAVDPSAVHEFYIKGMTMIPRTGTAADARGDSLRNAAAETGGDVFIGWTEMDRVVESIERDASRFYLLSYVPPREVGDGLYHEIHVEVDRAGADVRARRGYVHYTEQDRHSRILSAALDLPGTATGIDIAVAGVRAREPDGQPLLIVDTAVRADSAPAADTRVTDPAAMLVFATVRDRAGTLVASTEQERLTPAASTAPSAGSGGASTHWTHRAVHRLEPGRYDVRVAIIDPRTERVGAAALDVEIEDAAGDWGVSDPWLAVQGPGDALTPVVDGRVVAGQKVVAYVEVYNGVTPSVSGRILAGARLDEMDRADERSGAAASDAAAAGPRGPSIALTEVEGIHRGGVPLTALPPGHYVLEFRIDDTGAGHAKTVRLPLDVVAPQ